MEIHESAENYLERAAGLPDARPVMVQVYRAHIALARYDEKTADGIIEDLVAAHSEDSGCLPVPCRRPLSP